MRMNGKGTKILTVSLLAVMMNTAVAGAATKKAKEPEAPLPIVVTSDHMRYHDDTGDITAEGNVVITQGTQKLSAAVVEGNSQSGDVKIDGRSLYEVMDATQHIVLEGGPVVYNWIQRSGSIDEPKGHIDENLVRGDSIDLLPDKYVVREGRVTRCTKEEDPHYCMLADRIDIIPGQSMTAYNVKVQLLGRTLYSQSKYTTSLRPEDRGKSSAWPKIGYNSDNGAYVVQHFSRPLTDRVSAFADAAWYSKHGFTPYGGVRYDGNGYEMQIVDGVLYDSDGHKLIKEPEFQFATGKRKIGDTPYYYNLSASYGKWDDELKSSWHSEEKIYFSRDPIYLREDKGMWLALGAGTGYLHESYLHDGWQTYAYDAVLYKKWQRWQANTGYHYNEENRNLFDYERADLSNYWETGVTYQASAKDSFGVITRYDMNDNRIYDLDLKWYRNLNDCFQTEFTYKQKQRKFEYKIHVLTW